MALDKAQRGVAVGMGATVLFSAILLALAYIFKPFGGPDTGDMAGRLKYVLRAGIVPFLWLLVSIGNVARARFFSPADINGSGLTEASARIRVGAAVLQNTLEQSVLAAGGSERPDSGRDYFRNNLGDNPDCRIIDRSVFGLISLFSECAAMSTYRTSPFITAR